MSAVSPIGLLLGAIRLYEFLIFAYVLMSWFPAVTAGSLSQVYRVLASVCEPFVGFFRRILPSAAAGGSGLDFSPVAAILALQVLALLVARAF